MEKKYIKKKPVVHDHLPLIKLLQKIKIIHKKIKSRKLQLLNDYKSKKQRNYIPVAKIKVNETEI